jgi:hypothetical protein
MTRMVFVKIPSTGASPHAGHDGFDGDQAGGSMRWSTLSEIIDGNMVEQCQPDDADIVEENPNRAASRSRR